MKSLIKKIMPEWLVQPIRRMRTKRYISELYRFDKNRMIQNAYSMNNTYSEENLRAKITYHYHAIEKGLSNADLRLGFGERAFKELFWAMDEYIRKEYTKDDYRFQGAISVIKSYIDLHRVKNYSVDWIENKMKIYMKYLRDENTDIGGFEIISSNELPDYDKLTFIDLASRRYSIRDFGEGDIEDTKVFESINIATKTPSVCNRQSWKVRYIKSPGIVKETLRIQNGLAGNGENLRKIIVVTADKQYMNGGHERNQTYIDGGLFTMSLLYALTSKNIASCTLNTSFDLLRETEMRKLLDINVSEDFIAVIAIGTYPDKFKVAKSPRDDYSLFTTIID